MSCRQLAALRGKGTVFVHVDAAALTQQAGVARVEGMGPMLVQSLAELLGHHDVTLQPVIDLSRQVRADRYEHGESLKDTVWLLTGGDVFPFSPRTATRDDVDFDHVKAYDRHGPPGQTGTHNSGPAAPATSPLEDPRRLPLPTGRPRPAPLADPPRALLPGRPHRHPPARPHQAELILTAPPGVDVYVPDVRLDYQPAG